jgi:WD40 repeat protein
LFFIRWIYQVLRVGFVLACVAIACALLGSTHGYVSPQCNPITAVCVSKDKRWIATADSGEDNMIVVWDSSTATPVKIIPKPYEKGIVAMDMSSDAMFLVTLSDGAHTRKHGGGG